jgi:hypothetical protein
MLLVLNQCLHRTIGFTDWQAASDHRDIGSDHRDIGFTASDWPGKRPEFLPPPRRPGLRLTVHTEA